jgi:hypothetical protein
MPMALSKDIKGNNYPTPKSIRLLHLQTNKHKLKTLKPNKAPKFTTHQDELNLNKK